MATLVVKHGVDSFETWRPAYDEADSLRRKHGCTSERVLRDANNESMVLVQHEFPTVEAAQGFMNDPDLGEAMQKAGVSGPPTIEFYIDG